MLEVIKAFTVDRLFEEQQSGDVEGRYYLRKGACNTCGRCCTNIYLVHDEEAISSPEQFAVLQKENPEYAFFTPVDRDEHGVRFQCGFLSPENRCTIYDDRPSFCRKYPSEKGMLLGGQLAQGCGYYFEPKIHFNDVLAKVARKKRLKAGKLES